jgi:hypothetical protein
MTLGKFFRNETWKIRQCSGITGNGLEFTCLDRASRIFSGEPSARTTAIMRLHSRQILTVEETFGQNGWYCELVDGRDVLRAGFEAHHTRVDLVAQAYPQLNALSIVSESPMPLDAAHLSFVLELLARANKQLTIGGFEFDLDREMLVFRITNLFERERFDSDIVCSMVHCAIAELDRITPYVAIVRDTPVDLLTDLDLQRLLMREDVIPPVPGDEEEEY